MNVNSVMMLVSLLLTVGLIPQAKAEVIELEGTVKAVDAATRVITIERKTPSGTKTLELEVAKKAGELGNVKAGDRIKFGYDPTLEIVTRLGSGEGRAAQPQDAAYKARPASKGPGEREKEICKEVCRKLEQEHFLEPRIDRALASKMLDTFLRSLDPMKMYFLQSDIDSFKNAVRGLPTALKQGDSSLAFTIYDRFLSRVEARLPAIESLIDATHDFKKDESVETKPALTRWVSTDAEAKDKWRRRIKYDLLMGKMQGEKEAAVKQRLLRRYRSFLTHWNQMTSDELLEKFLSSLYSSVDGLSQYMSPETLVNFEIQMRRQLDGIGSELKSEDGIITVVNLTPGGAASKDGRLKPGDRIVGIAQGSDGDFVDVQDMRLNDVVDLIRGERGTVVRLRVLSSGNSTPKVYDITRRKIALKNAEITGEVFEVGRRTNGSPRKVGLVRIPGFYMDMEAARRGDKDYRSSTKDCKALLEGFRRQNVELVVVDLRGNGGGFLPEVIKTAGLFIDRGRVLQIKQRDGEVKKYDDIDGGSSWAGLLVVLVNRRTAGGAELFAGAIQDHNRGIIVGDELTNGSATSMTIIPVAPTKQLGAVKMLQALIYRPSGEGVYGKGVRSDLVLPSLLDVVARQGGAGDKARVFDRLGSDGFRPAMPNAVSDLVGELQKRSDIRLGKDRRCQDFIKMLQDIEKNNQTGRVSINEVEFEREWKKGQSDSTGSAVDDVKSGESDDFYMDEVLNIASDMIEILN